MAPSKACFVVCSLALAIAALPGTQYAVHSTQPAGDKLITNAIGMKLALIPAGKFMMGSPATEDERDTEELQHEVEITKPFYMGIYEVTQGEFEKLAFKDNRANAFFRQGADFPMEQIRWPATQEFCKRLSALPDEVRAKRVYRLPTEAEWEYAARAGTTTVFHFGDTLSSKQANFKGTFPFGKTEKGPFVQKTAKVGSYAPNAWGLYDMHGNVGEWCSDFYDPDYYKKSPKKDPQGPEKGVMGTDFGDDFYRVIRGGCWLDEGRACRAAYRFRLQSAEGYRWVGFRVVCEVKS